MEITHKLIPSTEENRAALEPGENYAVLYWDCGEQKQKLTGARVEDAKGDEKPREFKFCAREFVFHKNAVPTFGKKMRRHRIVGWYQINQWRMKDD